MTQPIIGADFLSYFHLLPNLHTGELLDEKIAFRTKGTTTESQQESVKAMTRQTQYYKILTEFPGITTPNGKKKTLQHNTMHYIQTTTGPPEACKPWKSMIIRRLNS